MFARTHTVAAVALIAAVPLGPVGMWTYARVAGADHAAQRREVARILARVRPPRGARRSFVQELALRAWDGEGLVPVKTWRFVYADTLSRALTPAAVTTFFAHELPDWAERVQPFPCRVVSQKPGCAARTVTFRKDGWEIQLDLAETLRHDGQTLATYELRVSQ